MMHRAGWSGVIALVLCAAAAADSSVALQARRYEDPWTGFSLRPPTETERVRKRLPSPRVTWTRRDAATGAVAWQLSVRAAQETHAQIEPKAYAEALATKLQADSGYQVSGRRVTTVAGRPAIDLRGAVPAGQGMLYGRQVWIIASAEPGADEPPAPPHRLLIVTITGPRSDGAKLDGICDAVLATLRVIDPVEAARARKELLARGEKLLQGLTPVALRKLLHSGPQWFLFSLRGDVVGFMKAREAAVRRHDADGIEVVKWVVLDLPGPDDRDPPAQLLKSVKFAAAAEPVAAWRERLQVGRDPVLQRTQEDGLQQKDLIVCTQITHERGGKGHIVRGQPRTLKKRMPQEIRGAYLNRCLGDLLGRIVDRDEKTAYAFATYNSQANAFDLRTYRVLGAESISHGGRRRKTTHVQDQAAADREPTDLWLDEEGRILRMRTAEGLHMERVDRGEVRKHFPRAERTVEQLDRLDRASR